MQYYILWVKVVKNVKKWGNVTGFLTGKFEFSIDAKGRISIPAKFREILGECGSFHIVRVPKFRLRILPRCEWEKKAQVYANLPETEEFHEYTINFYNSQTNCDSDAQGRITIPKWQLDLIKYKGGKIVLLGMGKYLEACCVEYENSDINSDKNEKDFADYYYKVEREIGKFEQK